MISKNELQLLERYICNTCEKANGRCPLSTGKLCPQLEVILARVNGQIKGK